MTADVTKLTRETLAGTVWRYYHRGNPEGANKLRLSANGSIGGYTHPNEAKWDVVDDELCFFSSAGQVTVRFTSAAVADGLRSLHGPCVPQPMIILHLDEQIPAPWPKPAGTKAHFTRQIAEQGWEIGDHTYGLPAFFEMHMARVRIGKYCSIAGGVQIALGNHRADCVSTYPFRALREHWHGAPAEAADHVTRGDVVIGNDVWLGANAFITSGITIGDGAIIGAHAVVTKDVPPYAVVVGNPARLIRTRFDAPTIQALLAIRWWDWPDDAVDAALELMMQPDLGPFLAKYGEPA